MALQLQHPRLRSQLVWIHGKPAFQVCPKPIVKVEVLEELNVDDLKPENDGQGWLRYVEDELNINLWPEREHSVEPVQLFLVRLYRLPQNHSLMILRVHTAACDRVSAGTVFSDILKALLNISRGELVVLNSEAEMSGLLEVEVSTGKFIVFPSTYNGHHECRITLSFVI